MELYVHIPFCIQKCRYCGFASFVGQEAYYEKYIGLILKEASSRIREAEESVQTVYIGGGTPSLLPEKLLRILISGLRGLYTIEEDAEITAEANPGTVSASWLSAAAGLGVNRLSFGMQAYQEHLLRILGRIHHFEEVMRSVELARQAGISNISLDLMFGIPEQTEYDWEETLNRALSLHPTHISTYGLIPEKGTPLLSDLNKGILSLPDPDAERRMYDLAISTLQQHGFSQYEISSFALANCECRHNIGYWTQVPYIGLGVSAASMTQIIRKKDGISYSRRTNPDTLSSYFSMMESDSSLYYCEKISPIEARFETMMLGFRMNRGIPEKAFQQMHGVTMESCYGDKLSDLEQKGLLIHTNGIWKMTRRGFDIQNSILVELME